MWESEILKFRESENLRFLDSGNLRIWESETLWFWGSEILRIWGSEILRFWESEILRIWDSANLTIWDSENLKIWESESLTFWESKFRTWARHGHGEPGSGVPEALGPGPTLRAGAQLPVVYEKCTKSVRNVHGKCTKTLQNVYKKCTNSMEILQCTQRERKVYEKLQKGQIKVTSKASIKSHPRGPLHRRRELGNALSGNGKETTAELFTLDM